MKMDVNDRSNSSNSMGTDDECEPINGDEDIDVDDDVAVDNDNNDVTDNENVLHTNDNTETFDIVEPVKIILCAVFRSCHINFIKDFFLLNCMNIFSLIGYFFRMFISILIFIAH